MRSLIFAFAILFTFALLKPCWAERAYVTDSLEITLRTGPSTEHRVMATLSSGTSLEILGSVPIKADLASFPTDRPSLNAVSIKCLSTTPRKPEEPKSLTSISLPVSGLICVGVVPY